MRKIKIATLFIRNNYKKAIPSIMTLTTFLLILNILLGILFSTTGLFSDTIVDNSSVHFMEIINNGDRSEINKIKTFIENQKEISDSFFDTSHPIIIECDNNDGFQTYSLLGVPKQLLPRLGLKSSSDKFLFLPQNDKKYYSNITSVEIEETLYPEKEKNGKAEIQTINYEVTGFYQKIQWDLFPENVAIIDSETANKIALRSNPEKEILSDRIIAFVPDVASMKNIEQKIKESFLDAEVKYSLKFTNNLPQYAKVFIAISGIIVLILVLFCIVNIKESVHQILNIRKRDVGLLSLFGVENKNIFTIFMFEFLLYGVASFSLSFVSSSILFIMLKIFFSIDLISKYVLIYLFADIVIALLMFICISAIQIKLILKKIDSAKIFKEILK